VAAALAITAGAAPASAQIDPLLFLKTTQPNVIFAVDLDKRMLRDAPTNASNYDNYLDTSNYYDPYIYSFSALNVGVATSLGLDATNTSAYYRRKYAALKFTSNASSDKFTTTGITGVGDRASGYANFEAPTRIAIARAAIDQAVRLNQSVVRFGLIRMRQASPTVASELNSGPVLNSNASQLVGDVNSSGRWKISRPTVSSSNGAVNTSGVSVQPDAANANTTLLTTVGLSAQTTGSLLPASQDDLNTIDAPIKYLLDDAKAEATRLIAADTNCRNIVVVLIVGGGEGTTSGSPDLGAAASSFASLSGRRVPIHVIAIAPPDTDRAQLQAVAANSGGRYTEITKAMIDAALASPSKPALNSAPPAGTVPVPEAVTAINVAVQHAFAQMSDFNGAASSSEFPTGSPIVGTVNLENAKDITGASLPNTIVKDKSGAVIPQRANVLLNSGFALPGFDGKLRAFRMYKPEADSTRVAGYKFVNDGTRLWVASVPSAVSRNIYTVLPTGSMIKFHVDYVTTLATYMNVSVTEATAIIDHVRSQPLGAIVDSTPAVMDPPSVDPPPDSAYPGFIATNANRRSLIWIGTNDGMLHAIDGRLGQEVWAYIPFNLLPKLKELRFGQSVGNFNFFADGSPKVADVKVSAPCAVAESSCWRTYLFFGEGPGGTYYQAFDVTLSDMGNTVSPTSDTIGDVLTYFSDASKVTFKWAFPTYSNFDYTIAPWGDVKSTATDLEKTVGQSWGDPAVGQIESEAGRYALLTGSGFLPYSAQQQSNRGGIVAGTTFYLLNVETGAAFDSVSVTTDGQAETVNSCASANDCTKMKNAIQADPVATGPPNSRYITMAYVGDLDGRVWRFDLGTNSATGNPYIKTKPGTKLWDGGGAHPLFSSMATVNVGNTQQYVFFGTGSDLLPSNNVNQQYKLVGVLDNGSSGTQTFSSSLTKVDGVGADEKVSAFPAVAGDIVFFTTTTFNPTTPCTLPSAKLYALTFIGGPAYDTTGDEKITNSDTILVTTIANTRATAPFVSDRHLLFGTGAETQIFGDPEGYANNVGQAGVRILSWRELR
jgi:hypothetical protein